MVPEPLNCKSRNTKSKFFAFTRAKIKGMRNFSPMPLHIFTMWCLETKSHFLCVQCTQKYPFNVAYKSQRLCIQRSWSCGILHHIVWGLYEPVVTIFRVENPPSIKRHQVTPSTKLHAVPIEKTVTLIPIKHFITSEFFFTFMFTIMGTKRYLRW